MMSLLLRITLQIFIIRKQAKKIIKVDSKSSNLSPDWLKNIDFSGNHKQSTIVYENG